GEVGHQLGGGDQRLARHAVRQHGRAAEAVGVDDGHVPAELARDQRRLVAAGSATDDHHSLHSAHPPRHRTPRPNRTSYADPGASATSLTRVTLYAAYGTNLDPARMGERCPHSPLRG